MSPAFLTALCLGRLMLPAAPPAPVATNTLGNPPHAVHETQTLHDQSAGRDGFAAAGSDRDKTHVFVTEWTPAAIAFNELIPSWNIRLPEGARYQVELRVANKDGAASDWYWFGPHTIRADDRPDNAARPPPTGDAFGDVHTDYLLLRRPADRVQVRIAFDSPGGRIDRFVLAVSNTTGDKRLWDARRIKPRHFDPSTYTRRLDVPFRSQHVQNTAMQGNICSPTSVAMVMAFRGVDRSPEQVASAALDPVHKIYGNWPLNVQAAASFGIPGYIRRFAALDEAHALIAQGQPIIASIRDPDGRLKGTPYQSTVGHLLVICGFDDRGNVLVSDPAGRDAAHGRLTYDREQFERAWIGAGGVAYILEEPPRRDRTPNGTP